MSEHNDSDPCCASTHDGPPAGSSRRDFLRIGATLVAGAAAVQALPEANAGADDAEEVLERMKRAQGLTTNRSQFVERRIGRQFVSSLLASNRANLVRTNSVMEVEEFWDVTVSFVPCLGRAMSRNL